MEQLSRRLENLLGIVRDNLGTNDENAPGKAAFLARLAELGLRDDLTKRPAAPTSMPGSARLAPASQRPASGGTS
jgi:hypothetical protein